MRSRDVLLIARRQAALSQAVLASRLGVARETVARWEAGAHDPSFETLQRAVAACGLEFAPRIYNEDGSLQVLIGDQLLVEPLQRVYELLPEPLATRCEEALRAIASLSVDGVLCGPVGAVLLGGPNRPWMGRVDVAIDPHENAAALADLLELGALPDAAEDRWGEHHRREPWTLPGGGQLAVLLSPAGTHGAEDLRRDALTVAVDEVTSVLVAHPRDLVRVAYASPDDRDHAMSAGYVALLEVLMSQAPAIAA